MAPGALNCIQTVFDGDVPGTGNMSEGFLGKGR